MKSSQRMQQKHLTKYTFCDKNPQQTGDGRNTHQYNKGHIRQMYHHA